MSTFASFMFPWGGSIPIEFEWIGNRVAFDTVNALSTLKRKCNRSSTYVGTWYTNEFIENFVRNPKPLFSFGSN
jgi:hypothetical protein